MNKRYATFLFLATLIMGSAHAALYVNTGATATPAGQGPTGADANYLAYTTTHEDNASSTTGQLTTFNSVSFAEGGLGGTYDVGVAFTWLDFTARQSKQAFDDRTNSVYDTFWESWVGIDSRTSNGGIGGSDRIQLNLSGLAANQAFTFTSYNADGNDQSATFTVDQTPTASETATSPFDWPALQFNDSLTPATTNAYSFDVTSDALGNLDITYTMASGTFFGVNGFDLVAVVPEPSSALMLLFVSSALLLRRSQSLSMSKGRRV